MRVKFKARVMVRVRVKIRVRVRVWIAAVKLEEALGHDSSLVV